MTPSIDRASAKRPATEELPSPPPEKKQKINETVETETETENSAPLQTLGTTHLTLLPTAQQNLNALFNVLAKLIIMDAITDEWIEKLNAYPQMLNWHITDSGHPLQKLGLLGIAAKVGRSFEKMIPLLEKYLNNLNWNPCNVKLIMIRLAHEGRWDLFNKILNRWPAQAATIPYVSGIPMSPEFYETKNQFFFLGMLANPEWIPSYRLAHSLLKVLSEKEKLNSNGLIKFDMEPFEKNRENIFAQLITTCLKNSKLVKDKNQGLFNYLNQFFKENENFLINCIFNVDFYCTKIIISPSLYTRCVTDICKGVYHFLDEKIIRNFFSPADYHYINHLISEKNWTLLFVLQQDYPNTIDCWKQLMSLFEESHHPIVKKIIVLACLAGRKNLKKLHWKEELLCEVTQVITNKTHHEDPKRRLELYYQFNLKSYSIDSLFLEQFALSISERRCWDELIQMMETFPNLDLVRSHDPETKNSPMIEAMIAGKWELAWKIKEQYEQQNNSPLSLSDKGWRCNPILSAFKQGRMDELVTLLCIDPKLNVNVAFDDGSLWISPVSYALRKLNRVAEEKRQNWYDYALLLIFLGAVKGDEVDELQDILKDELQDILKFEEIHQFIDSQIKAVFSSLYTYSSLTKSPFNLLPRELLLKIALTELKVRLPILARLPTPFLEEKMIELFRAEHVSNLKQVSTPK